MPDADALQSLLSCQQTWRRLEEECRLTRVILDYITTNTPMMVLDLEGRIVRLNQADERATGELKCLRYNNATSS